MAAYTGAAPTADENLLRAVAVYLSSIFWMLPCEVTGFRREPSGGPPFTSVFVNLRSVVTIRDDRGRVVEVPSIVDVPVAWPRGGGYSFTYPLIVGDTGMCHFASSSIAAWLFSGDARSNPEGRRQGALTDAMFYPGGAALCCPPESAKEDSMHIGRDGDVNGRISIDAAGAVVITSTDIRAGSSSATDPVSLSSLSDANNDAIELALDAIAAAAGTSNPYSASTVAATKLKAE